MNNPLLDIRGVGPDTARLLAEAGFTSVASIADAEPRALAMVRGIGPVRAVSLRTEAQRLLVGGESVSSAVASGERRGIETGKTGEETTQAGEAATQAVQAIHQEGKVDEVEEEAQAATPRSRQA